MPSFQMSEEQMNIFFGAMLGLGPAAHESSSRSGSTRQGKGKGKASDSEPSESLASRISGSKKGSKRRSSSDDDAFGSEQESSSQIYPTLLERISGPGASSRRRERDDEDKPSKRKEKVLMKVCVNRETGDRMVVVDPGDDDARVIVRKQTLREILKQLDLPRGTHVDFEYRKKGSQKSFPLEYGTMLGQQIAEHVLSSNTDSDTYRLAIYARVH